MPPRNPSGGAVALTPGRRLALAHLLEATSVALELGQVPSAFACQLASLHDAGVTDTTLRWLIAKGLAEHCLETTRKKQPHRTFRRAVNAHFTGASCFVLTQAGRDVAMRLKRKPRRARPRGIADMRLPRYDVDCRTLHFRGQIVKRYKRRAQNQELILLSFEEENWPPHLADPLPGVRDMDPKRRLNDAIKNLNANQLKPILRFHGDGKGTGIIWRKLP